MSTDRTGTELAGYAIRSQIGRGGMGIVYRADQLGANGVPRRTVALKVLDPVQAADEEFRQRFLRESEIAMAIEHSSVKTWHTCTHVTPSRHLRPNQPRQRGRRPWR